MLRDRLYCLDPILQCVQFKLCLQTYKALHGLAPSYIAVHCQSVHLSISTNTPLGLCFTDQFAFRPTGSTTAPLITLIHTDLTMLSVDPFVRLFAVDFSKAFDMVRHSTLLEKMACLDLPLPDEVYNPPLLYMALSHHKIRRRSVLVC